eukprot:TRINITY_DN4410_c0_g1_i1.p1 TRINITY_DN4410_c0_g1~~TRINITY_DN4410_c0_g1_i1.p1  ORF type:complete len:506 (-),score=163.45 TRINITY_DN4410_c0_g1_i1:233-1630(-)
MASMGQEVQQFASAPQAVGARSKYRDPNDTGRSGHGNIMYDRRVVRGNTYAALVQPEPDMAEVQKQREAQRRRLMRANQTRKRPGTPEAVPGRKHTDIQTDSYLEELTERVVEFEAETQTDFILDRPPSPLFMPAKIGIDIETQIEDGELFDFDVECEPILEVLVGKTLEQSMMEVLEEEELASLQRHQEEFEKRRNAELLEVQRMEAAETRRSDETQRRVQQQNAQRERDLSTMKKVLSRSIAQQYLSGLQDILLQDLKDAGTFADKDKLAVESTFMANLLQGVKAHMEKTAIERKVADSIAASSVTAKLEQHSKVLDIERRRLAQIDDAERKSREEKQEALARRQREAEKVQKEQELMMQWEAFIPDPPPKPDELQIMEIKAEELLAVLEDQSTAVIPEDKLEELQTLFAQAAEEGQTLRLLGKTETQDPAEGDEGEAKTVLASFRLGVPGEAPAAEAEEATQ